MASPRRQQTFQPVTMGHIRSHGCRDLLVYCTSPWCNHDAKINGDWLPDDTVLLDLDARMICTACGLIGADVRPDWTPNCVGITVKRVPLWIGNYRLAPCNIEEIARHVDKRPPRPKSCCSVFGTIRGPEPAIPET